MIFQSDLIVMGDLLRWKMRRFFQSGKNTNDFSKWSYCNEQPAQVENTKVF